MSPSALRGSQKWLQVAVNESPHELRLALQRSGAIGASASVSWRCPLQEHNYREFRDMAALAKVDIAGDRLRIPLGSFWPKNGPVWDALGVSSDAVSLFLEAKAHIPEAATPGTTASERSRARITASLREARRYFAPGASADWSSMFYQYANRLAHHYFLSRINRIQTRLVFLYFVNAVDISGPASEEEWRGAIALIHAALGLRADLRRFGVFEAFLDVKRLADKAV
jgi:hypothetical protein